MREDEMTSGPLYIGRAVFEPRPIRVTRISLEDFEIFASASAYLPYTPPSTITACALDANEIDKDYEAQKCRIHVSEPGHRHEVVVDKRTHRIRFENETEHEVTIVVEPK